MHRLRWRLKFMFIHIDIKAFQQRLLKIFSFATEFLHSFCLKNIYICEGPFLDCLCPSFNLCLSSWGLSYFSYPPPPPPFFVVNSTIKGIKTYYFLYSSPQQLDTSFLISPPPVFSCGKIQHIRYDIFIMYSHHQPAISATLLQLWNCPLPSSLNAWQPVVQFPSLSMISILEYLISGPSYLLNR